MPYNKRRIYGKIGTGSSKEIVLWANPKIEVGEKIIAMDGRSYDNLSSGIRRLRSCNSWTRYRITDINSEGFVFLSL